MQNKNKQNERFFKCKTKCSCKGVCAAKGLKQCPVCQEIKKSVCSKIACMVNGIKPTMITLDNARSRSKSKKKIDETSDDDYSDACDESEDEVEDSLSEDEDLEMPVESDLPENASQKLLKTWRHLSPPTQESEILGMWYAGIWENKKTKKLCIGRLLKRFLHDKDGDVHTIELSCLKPKVGLGTIMEETPDHLPDIALFNLEDIIAGPITALPLKSKKWDICEYHQIALIYEEVCKMDRLALKELEL